MKPTAPMPKAARTRTGHELTIVETNDSPNDDEAWLLPRGAG
ncbi:Uncharacterised protein [Mycobacteroides abscessus subsp. abscessus]|nr:Uncharacterised protein [Mycobacteroides abscessus subsp. abscessus]